MNTNLVRKIYSIAMAINKVLPQWSSNLVFIILYKKKPKNLTIQ